MNTLRKALFGICFLIPLQLALAADWPLVRVPVPEEPEALVVSGFQLFHRAGDFWIGRLPEGVPLPTGGQILSGYNPEGGDLFRLLLASPGEGEKLVGKASILYMDKNETIIQATLQQLQALPSIRAEWVHITLIPKPMGYFGGLLPTTDEFSPYVEEMVTQISQDQYTEYLQTLEDFVTRNSHTPNCDDAAAWILSRFQSFGLYAYFDEFLLSGQTKYSVVGELIGQVYPDSVFFITGHYDATAGQPWTAEPIAPGACDNGSGASCVIECARILSRYNFEKSIRFVAFGGEEQGLVGSFDYVQDLQASGIDVAGSFNYDMISYRGSASPPYNFNIISDNNPNSLAMADKLVEAAQTFLPSLLSGSVSINPGSASSDHYPFWTMGWAATFSIQAYSYPYYHSVNDLLIYNHMEYATYITKAALAALADFAVPMGGSTEVSGSVSSQWTLEGSPYCVVDSIWVPPDSTLTIDAGVLILFQGQHKFKVLENAALKASGTVENPIHFMPFEPEGNWHGIRFYGASDSSRLEHCRLTRGLATGTGDEACGGAIFCFNSSPTIVHCLISDCSADFGGAIYCASGSNPTLINNTLSNNSATSGGGIYCSDSDPNLTNCILWNNALDEIALSGSSSPQVTYCDITGGWAGEGNIDTDPLFVNPGAGDYHLQSTIGRYFYGLWMSDSLYSPCIDAGDPASAYGDEPEPNGDRINMGAFGNTGQASLSLNDPHYAFGEVTGIWTAAQSPMYVFGNIYVPEEGTLTIEPGVQVIFLGHYQFDVLENGVLYAVGTPQDSITFSPEDTSEGWSAIRFQSASDSCRLEYCCLTYGVASGAGGTDVNGGAIFCDSASPMIRHCLIENCQATNGGGVYLSGSNAEISGCRIRANSANSGGAIYCHESNPSITGNLIFENTGTNGGGMSFWSSQGDVANNVIFDNIATGLGGGLYLFNSDVTVVNNTICENEANFGDGIYNAGNVIPVVINCILWNNFGQQIYLGGGLAPQVTYCDVQGSWEGEGNIDDDPRFETGPLSDFHLGLESPCIDGGHPDPQYHDPEDPGNPGFALWPAQGTVRNDMGAYGGGGASIWVGVAEKVAQSLPSAFQLVQNYPNPFNPMTRIRFELPVASFVNLSIYDISGRLVATLVDGWRSPGAHEVTLDASELSSGLYLYHIEVGSGDGRIKAVRKMVLLK